MNDSASTNQIDLAHKLEEIKHISPTTGVEYWRGREIMPVLGYATWENFRECITRAEKSCAATGVEISQHFRDTTKRVRAGSGATREADDCYLTRYGCYLTAMNGDSSKPEIGFAQTYFAIQARRQEVQDQTTVDDKRIELRKRVKDANRNLSSVAKRAGVKNFGVFHDAGYSGLYGGKPSSAVKVYKGLEKTDDLFDRCSRTELAMNEFRLTQTEDKITKEQIRGEDLATKTHHDVGAEVRDTVKRIGGTMPENLPLEPSLKRIQADRLRQAKIAERAQKQIASKAAR